MKPEWKIYYADGSTFSDLDGSWEEAPTDQVVCCVMRDPTGAWGRFVLHGGGWYAKFPGETLVNPEDPEPTMRRSGLFKQGIQLPKEKWTELMNQAAEDPDFEKKSPRRRKTDWR